MEPLLKARATGQVSRGNDLATIHIEAAACGLIKPARDGFPKNDDDYRQLVRTLSNGTTDSAAKLDHAQRAQLIHHLRVLKRVLGLDTLPQQWRMLRALWSALAERGMVDANTEAALNKWTRRQCGKASARWANNDELEKLIEAAKAWLARSVKG